MVPRVSTSALLRFDMVKLATFCPPPLVPVSFLLPGFPKIGLMSVPAGGRGWVYRWRRLGEEAVCRILSSPPVTNQPPATTDPTKYSHFGFAVRRRTCTPRFRECSHVDEGWKGLAGNERPTVPTAEVKLLQLLAVYRWRFVHLQRETCCSNIWTKAIVR